MELKQPKRKRFSGKVQSQSLPVLVESISGITASNSLWPVYIGTFSGDSVIISSRDEMTSLYNMVSDFNYILNYFLRNDFLEFYV